MFPIPPGVKWSDEMPRVLPRVAGAGAALLVSQSKYEVTRIAGEVAAEVRALPEARARALAA